MDKKILVEVVDAMGVWWHGLLAWHGLIEEFYTNKTRYTMSMAYNGKIRTILWGRYLLTSSNGENAPTVINPQQRCKA